MPPVAIVTGRTNGDTDGGGSTAPAGRPDTSGGIPGQPGDGRGKGAPGQPGQGTGKGAPGQPGGERRRARPLSEAGRIRQPVALIRLLTGLLAITLTLLLADYARATTGGFAADVAEADAAVRAAARFWYRLRSRARWRAKCPSVRKRQRVCCSNRLTVEA